jgi:hypothetical protein
MTTTTEEIPQLLKNLRLRKMAVTIENELQAARKSSLPTATSWFDSCAPSGWISRKENYKRESAVHISPSFGL